jgi:hypothetical protein
MLQRHGTGRIRFWPAAVFFNGLDKWVPHIHCHRFNGFSLFGAHLIKEADQGISLTIFAYKNNAAGQVIKYDGHVLVATTNSDFIHSQDAKTVQIGITVMLFQELFINGLNRFPVQIQVFGHLSNRHHLTQLVNIISQASGDSYIRVKQLKLLNADTMTFRAKYLPVMAIDPDLG